MFFILNKIIIESDKNISLFHLHFPLIQMIKFLKPSLLMKYSTAYSFINNFEGLILKGACTRYFV